MNFYTVIYKRQKFREAVWIDDDRSNNILFILAKDDAEAKEYADTAIAKLNKHAEMNAQYVLTTKPIKLVVASVCHDIINGTSVTPIWGEDEKYEAKSIK